MYLAGQTDLKISLVDIFPIQNYNSGWSHEYVNKLVEKRWSVIAYSLLTVYSTHNFSCSFPLMEKNQKIKTVRKNQKIQRFASLKFWNSSRQVGTQTVRISTWHSPEFLLIFSEGR